MLAGAKAADSAAQIPGFELSLANAQAYGKGGGKDQTWDRLPRVGKVSSSYCKSCFITAVRNHACWCHRDMLPFGW